MKNKQISLILALLLAVAWPMLSLAAQATGQGTKYAAAETPGAAAGPDTGTAAKCLTDAAGNTYYIFDGKKYAVESYWGQHYLTGFSAAETGNRKTASGAEVRQNYTAASTRANLGKVILVKAVGCSGEGGDFSRYDGVYKCQDTGGAAVEYGTANTGNVPVVDLYFEDIRDAYGVTDHGWITADIYILKEID